jgi:hypothetical protein
VLIVKSFWIEGPSFAGPEPSEEPHAEKNIKAPTIATEAIPASKAGRAVIRYAPFPPFNIVYFICIDNLILFLSIGKRKYAQKEWEHIPPL